jgi:3-hydroxybutyryl-CoA dehydratase
MRFEDLKIGQSYQMKRIFTQDEVMRFADLSFDTNPLHTNLEYAKTSQFGQLIVPGFLTASLFSAIIGTKFPGFGTIYLNQNMSFRKPVFLNQSVTAMVRVKELYPEKHRALLETCCFDENKELLIDGTALVKLP